MTRSPPSPPLMKIFVLPTCTSRLASQSGSSFGAILCATCSRLRQTVSGGNFSAMSFGWSKAMHLYLRRDDGRRGASEEWGEVRSELRGMNRAYHTAP